MTKEEILKTCEVFQIDGDRLYYERQVLKAMDEYGRQCFDAAREYEPDLVGYFDAMLKYHTYEDYLNNLLE